MKLVSPTGADIVGTAELVPGVALLNNSDITRNSDGTYEFEWAGETKLDWDGQTTVTRRVHRVFVDDNGEEFTENELQLVPESDDEEESDDLSGTEEVDEIE